MLINAPLRNSNEVIPLIEAGADTFYAGANSEVMFGDKFAAANRRPWREANFNSIADFRKALKLAHKNGKKIYVTLNNYLYVDDQILRMIDFVKKIKGVDGIIAGNLNVFLWFRKFLPQIELAVSTVGHVQNREAIKFYSNLGVKKIIFPRHFLLEEIQKLIVGNEHLEFECFIKNEDCSSIDGFCSYLEGPTCSASEDVFDFRTIFHPCRALFNCGVVSEQALSGREGKSLEKMFRNKKNLFVSCGICLIRLLDRMGVESVKIVGRAMPLPDKIKDVRFARFAADKSHLSEKDYLDRLSQKHLEIYGKACDRKCFYNFK